MWNCCVQCARSRLCAREAWILSASMRELTHLYAHTRMNTRAYTWTRANRSFSRTVIPTRCRSCKLIFQRSLTISLGSPWYLCVYREEDSCMCEQYQGVCLLLIPVRDYEDSSVAKDCVRCRVRVVEGVWVYVSMYVSVYVSVTGWWLITGQRNESDWW
jgi:hypothetical protein